MKIYRNLSEINTQRNGYLLLDMMITMAIVVTLFSISSVWIHKTFLYCASVNERDQHHSTISRIARELRNEATSADTISVNGDSMSIIQGNVEAIYSIKENTISCVQTVGDKSKIDRFTFAKNAQLRWRNSDQPNRVTLEIRRDFSKFTPDKSASSQLDAQISVRAGRKGR